MMRKLLMLISVVAGWIGLGILVGVKANPPEIVNKAELARVSIIEQVKPAVAAVCFYGGEACGSGVVIDPAGYALTNYHVVQPTGPILQCGLADGVLYDAVVVGIDRVGDVALVQLFPKEPNQPFPFVKLGDSDLVRAGDWSLAMGNPFGLSLDFSPTVTYGLVSGVNRYQPPEGRGTLEYTDCIQIETSINPGNSGGPLFNMKGELIGINGRGSFEKRGRVNSGVGYAISINQIKNFLGHLKAGLDTDHATLGAEVTTENEEGDLSRMIVRQILPESDAAMQGIEPGDQLVKFAGRPLTSTNQYKNILGIFPSGWRLPLTYRRGNQTREILVRLMGNLDRAANEASDEPKARPRGQQEPTAPKRPGMDESPANKFYEAKKGYANYYYNRLRQDQLREVLRKQGDYSKNASVWSCEGTIQLTDRRGNITLTWSENEEGLGSVSINRNGIIDTVTPLQQGLPLGELMLPQGSNGMLAALYQYHRLLTKWNAGFEAGFDHGGHEPTYPPPPPGTVFDSFKDAREDCEVIRAKHASLESKWYFSLKDRHLLAVESIVTRDELPCEIYFADYREVDGVELPHRMIIRVGEKDYATITIKAWRFGGKS